MEPLSPVRDRRKMPRKETLSPNLLGENREPAPGQAWTGPSLTLPRRQSHRQGPPRLPAALAGRGHADDLGALLAILAASRSPAGQCGGPRAWRLGQLSLVPLQGEPGLLSTPATCCWPQLQTLPLEEEIHGLWRHSDIVQLQHLLDFAETQPSPAQLHDPSLGVVIQAAHRCRCLHPRRLASQWHLSAPRHEVELMGGTRWHCIHCSGSASTLLPGWWPWGHAVPAPATSSDAGPSQRAGRRWLFCLGVTRAGPAACPLLTWDPSEQRVQPDTPVPRGHRG